VLQLGYKASSEQFGPREIVELTVFAEQQGFDSVAMSDHFQPWRHTGGHAPFVFAALAAAGERTRRIRLGTSVVTPTFRYHPAIVAQAVATLECLYPGRVWLGVGTGESMNEVPLGVEWPDSKERFARLKEAVELMGRLFSEERVSYEGQFYRAHNATLYDRPSTHVPIYIAASGPAAARLAGRVADGFICTSGKNWELYSEVLVPSVIEAAAKAGRGAQAVDMAIEIKVSFDTDRRRAFEETRHWAALALSPEQKVGVDDPLEMERLAGALSIEQAATRWIISDDPEEHVERIRPYIHLGFRHLIFHSPGADQRRFLQLYAQQVLPRLRDLTA